MKLTRKPSSGNPNAGFDVAGVGNVLSVTRQLSTLLEGIVQLEKTNFIIKIYIVLVFPPGPYMNLKKLVIIVINI